MINRMSRHIRIYWRNMNGRKACWCRSRLISRDVSYCASSAYRDIASQGDWQSMNESTKVLAIHFNSENGVLGCDRQFERLVSLNRVATMTLFIAPNLTLQMIANDCILLRSDTNVKHHIISWFQCSATLNVYLTPKVKNVPISCCGLLLSIY